MTFDWLKAAPWMLVILLSLGMAATTRFYLSERDDLVRTKAQVEQASKDAKTREDKIRQDHKDNLVELEKTHGRAKDIAVADAVYNYKLRHPANTGASGLRGPSTSQALGDGAEQELIPVDGATLQECAKDSNKVGYFQDYCKTNRCPIED